MIGMHSGSITIHRRYWIYVEHDIIIETDVMKKYCMYIKPVYMKIVEACDNDDPYSDEESKRPITIRIHYKMDESIEKIK